MVTNAEPTVHRHSNLVTNLRALTARRLTAIKTVAKPALKAILRNKPNPTPQAEEQGTISPPMLKARSCREERSPDLKICPIFGE
jgi:hypothetical protein